MATTIDAQDFHSYKPFGLKRKLYFALVALIQRLDSRMQERIEVESALAVQTKEMEVQTVEEIPFTGRYYLIHRWYLMIDNAWSWKGSIPLVIITAFFTWYVGEMLCLAEILSSS